MWAWMVVTLLAPGTPEVEADPARSVSLYLEAGGPGFLSLNAEGRVFHPALSVRFGLSWALFTSGFVVGASVLNDPRRNHHLELGVGIASMIAADVFGNVQDTLLVEALILGYRYEPPEKGLMIRLAFTPLLQFERTATRDPGRLSGTGRPEVRFQPLFGIALGYRFRLGPPP